MNETYKNVLVTGGCGRLGRQVYYELKDEYNITLFDRVSPDKQPFPWKPERGCKFVMGELTSLEDCMRAILISKADCILHLAGIPYATELGRFIYQRVPEDLEVPDARALAIKALSSVESDVAKFALEQSVL